MGHNLQSDRASSRPILTRLSRVSLLIRNVAWIALAGIGTSLPGCSGSPPKPDRDSAVVQSPTAASQPLSPVPSRQATTRTTDPLLREIASYPELHRAAAIGDAAAVRALLEGGADPKARAGQDGVTPLYVAIDGAFADALRRSMAPMGKVEEWSVAKARERERATRGQADPERGPMQFEEVTRLLLAAGADATETVLPTRGIKGATALQLAMRTGNAKIVRLLLEASRFDPNTPIAAPNRRETTALLALAAERGDLETVQTLLDAGADPARVPEGGQRTMRVAAFKDVNLLRLLMDHGLVIPEESARIAGRIGNAEVIAELERRGAAVDRDAAMLAAIQDKGKDDDLSPEEENVILAKVRKLLDDGASPSAPKETGEAILAAIQRGEARVAALLRERGGKVDWKRQEKSEYGAAFIEYSAAFIGKPERLRAYEELGMPLGTLGASVLGRDDRLKQLIAADPASVAGENGATALAFAARYGQLSCVRILLDANADPNARMPSWDTPDIGPRPLLLALQGGHEKVALLLLDRGADPKLIDSDDLGDVKMSDALRRRMGLND